jgi:ABC-type Fe3+-siderophore transport system permease subunit
VSRWRTRLRYGVLLAVLAVVLTTALTTGVALGSVAIAPSTVWQVVAAHLSGQALDAGGGVDGIVWQLRLPRVLLAAVAGASLTAVGVTIQALVRNPLADPYVLGVSSGASVGATAVLLFGSLGAAALYALSGAALLGALAAMVVVFAVAQHQGRVGPLRLVLVGMAMAHAYRCVLSVCRGCCCGTPAKHPEVDALAHLWPGSAFGWAPGCGREGPPSCMSSGTGELIMRHLVQALMAVAGLVEHEGAR